MAVPTAPIAAGSLVGGYAIARKGGRRRGAVASALLLGTGALLRSTARQRSGPRSGDALLGIYLGSFVVSHPMAKKLGAWPSVLLVSALSGAAAWAMADRGA